MRCKIPERDLVQRLDHTFCRYNGKPYYVRVDLGTLRLLEIDTKRAIVNINPDDPAFDISTIPLGYMQYLNNRVVYLSRTSMRIFKQGVSVENIAFHYIDGFGRGKTDLHNKQFINMIEGKYPSLEVILTLLQTDKGQYAVSRDIALTNDEGNPITVVYYKNKQVGWIPPNQRIVIVPSSDYAWIISKYLSELRWEVR